MRRIRINHRIYRTMFASLAVLVVCSLSFAGSSAAYHDISATQIVVNTTDDELNNDGDCSLREALQAANMDAAVDACPAGSGVDTVTLSIGTYTLTIPGKNENAGLTGDLDINSSLSILGAGMVDTIVDGGRLDRVFHITGNHSVRISGMTVLNGNVTGGGLYGGAGILNQGSDGNLTLTRSLLLDNQADFTGGGLDNAGTAALLDVTISGNSAEVGGGVFSNGTINLRNVTFTGNSAIQTGGGFDNNRTATLTNVTFSANTAPEGGGIHNDRTLTLVNTTLNANSNAIGNETAGSIRFKNTIVAGSTEGDNCTGEGTFTSEGYNLDSGESCNFTSTNDLSNTDPLLGPLQDNQGPTWTHALLEGSSAVDKGDNVDCPTTDQRGASRPADGDGDDSKVCDIGAYEHNGAFPNYMFLPLTAR